MVKFVATIEKFEEKAHQTGWCYIIVPQDIAFNINPNVKTGYRIKGFLDNFELRQVSLLPNGEGDFILPINHEMRKATGKKEGDQLTLAVSLDLSEIEISPELLLCLDDDPAAKSAFDKLPKSHKNYYSKWIESAKTYETKSKRIFQTIYGLANGLDYGATVRYFRDQNI